MIHNQRNSLIIHIQRNSLQRKARKYFFFSVCLVCEHARFFFLRAACFDICILHVNIFFSLLLFFATSLIIRGELQHAHFFFIIFSSFSFLPSRLVISGENLSMPCIFFLRISQFLVRQNIYMHILYICEGK
jgi:hypothetical protein